MFKQQITVGSISSNIKNKSILLLKFNADNMFDKIEPTGAKYEY